MTYEILPTTLVGGTGKTRNKEIEMGNRKREMKKMGIFLHNCIAFPLCIQQHLLEQTSATGDSGEEVEHACCVTSHRTGWAELVYGLNKLVEQLF